MKKWYPRDFDPLGARARGAFSAHEDFFNGLLGFAYLPATLAVSGPEYVHTRGPTRDVRETTHSREFPLQLAYICRSTLPGPTGRYTMILWIDTATGDIIGGDYSYVGSAPSK